MQRSRIRCTAQEIALKNQKETRKPQLQVSGPTEYKSGVRLTLIFVDFALDPKPEPCA